MEAPMTTPINSRAAIQARIAEWQRHYRNSDTGPVGVLYFTTKSPVDRVRW